MVYLTNPSRMKTMLFVVGVNKGFGGKQSSTGLIKSRGQYQQSDVNH